MRDLCTLQLGPLSNQIAVHFWNLQCSQEQLCNGESEAKPFDHHVLHEGTADSQRPRMLAIDLPSSIDHGFESHSGQTNHAPDYTSWSGDVDTIFRNDLSPTDMCKTIQTKWTLCVPPNERRLWLQHNLICTVPEMFHTVPHVSDTANHYPVSSFVQGEEILAPGKSFTEDVEDRLRRIIERSDWLSGLQMITDVGDAFGGMSVRLIEYVGEELPKRPILTLPIYDSCGFIRMDLKNQRISQANELALLVNLESTSDLFSFGSWIPIDSCSLVSNISDTCERAGILAAAWDTIITPLKSSKSCVTSSMDQFVGRAQLATNRRMLSTTMGHSITSQNIWDLHWSSLNPYNSHLNTTTSSLWRHVVSRGVRMDASDSKFIRNFTEGTDDLYRSIKTSEVNSKSRSLPSLKPGANLDMLSSLIDYPLVTERSKSHWCQQPSSIWTVSIVDIPGEDSAETFSLKSLVETVEAHSHRSPFEGIEQALWDEYKELARVRLIEAYSQ